MKRKIYNDCVVTIETAVRKSILWLEETNDETGKPVAYTIKKEITDKSSGKTMFCDMPCVKNDTGL